MLYFPLADSAGDLASLATVLAGHTTPAQIAGDIVDLGDALAALGLQVCEISQHLPVVRWRPNFNAGLPGQAVDYTLELANRGTVNTTYAVTVTLPGGVSTLNPTVAAGATYTETIAASSPTLGQFPLMAEAEATRRGRGDARHQRGGHRLAERGRSLRADHGCDGRSALRGDRRQQRPPSASTWPMWPTWRGTPPRARS